MRGLATYPQDLSKHFRIRGNASIFEGAGAMTDRESRDRKVLVVEDDEDARFLMRLELERLGYLVLEAADGEKGVEMAVEERPDIILMDLTLPLMDGITATEKIRATD